jgi:hypothetical protein
VVQRAVELGLWMGPDLADLAVAEKLAGSRPALATLLEERFATTLADAAVNDLDSDAADDNRKALAEEARAHGLARSSEPRTVASETASAASGQIVERRAPAVSDLRGRATPELVALLEDRAQRVAAALELCERGDAKTIRPLILAARRMGRADAVRVLGAMVKFGPAAAPALTAGLGSSKSYLRHGCALALAMLRTEQGTDAVIDLLLAEPTELWRELARAVGQVGPTAMMPLAARIGRLGERATPSVKERAAWAMAHIGVRGGKAAVEVLGGGSSVVAPVARQALDLMPAAARDDVQLTDAPRDVTVNRAFSRRFFETVDRQGGADGGGGRPRLAAALAAGGLVQAGAPEAAAGEELLDEAELIEDGVETDDDADLGELDEADLIDEA